MAGFYLWRFAGPSGLVCFATFIFSDACASKPSIVPAPETANAPAAAASMKGTENPPTHIEFQIEKPAQRIPLLDIRVDLPRRMDRRRFSYSSSLTVREFRLCTLSRFSTQPLSRARSPFARH